MKKLILVTGGDGRFCKILKKKNKILNLYFTPKKECNILDINSIEKVIKKVNPKIIIHLAWEGIPNFSKYYCKINYQNSIKLAKICLKIKNCKNVVRL